MTGGTFVQDMFNNSWDILRVGFAVSFMILGYESLGIGDVVSHIFEHCQY